MSKQEEIIRMQEAIIASREFWRSVNKCGLCWHGDCMCCFVEHRQRDGKGPYECEPMQPDEHMVPHDPSSAAKADAFIRQLRSDTRASRIARGCDPITGKKLNAKERDL